MALFTIFIIIIIINRYTVFFKFLAAFVAAFIAIIIIAIKLILIIVFFKLSLLITAIIAFFLLGKIRFSFSNKFVYFIKKIGLKQIN